MDNIVITPAHETKFLGIIIDDKLNFNAHISFLQSKCNSRLHLMRKLKTLGLNSTGLKTFYIANIRSILVYGTPAWYNILTPNSKDYSEKIQKSATRIIFPDFSYTDRLALLCIPTLNDFIFDLCQRHSF